MNYNHLVIICSLISSINLIDRICTLLFIFISYIVVYHLCFTKKILIRNNSKVKYKISISTNRWKLDWLYITYSDWLLPNWGILMQVDLNFNFKQNRIVIETVGTRNAVNCPRFCRKLRTSSPFASERNIFHWTLQMKCVARNWYNELNWTFSLYCRYKLMSKFSVSS